MSNVTLDELLTPRSKKPTAVRVDELGNGKILHILNPTPDQSDLCQTQWAKYRDSEDTPGNVGFSKFIVGWCLCDEMNKPMLDPGDEETPDKDFVEKMEQIGGDEGIDLRAHKRLSDAAISALGLSGGDVEELEGNSEAIPTDDGSGSKPSESDSAESNGSDDSTTVES